ncbi:MAG: acyl-CoA thioester hydrolase [Solirubrobacteraceae bacterium]|jgi:acyl-CoA thioesterase FadM|nr:acyl-CoA thioester hydrolase [Solirubrobacteraceae bacterium]
MAPDDDGLPDPARVTLRRRVEWIDTDAAGIYHWTTAFRFAEAAEAAMHTALGIADRTFGAMPRVAVDVRFTRPLRFNEAVDVELAVQAMGRSSVRYRLAIGGDAGPAVDGSLTVCLIDRETGRATPWPDDLRERLAAGGEQRAAS